MSVPASVRYQFKASPFPGAAASFGDMSTEEDPAQAAEEVVEQHEWAGDLFEDGSETDPAEAFARFNGGGGEEAWLDRAEDGTLTGWVRDTDGSVYRYSDVDAWAVDADEATMTRVDPAAEPAAVEGAEPAEGTEDPAEGDPLEEEKDLTEDPDAALDDDLDAEGDLDDEEDLEEDLDGEEDLEAEADVAAVEEDLVDELADQGADPEDLADAAADVAAATDEAAALAEGEDPEGLEDAEEEDEESEDDWVKRLEGKGLLAPAPAHRWSVRFGER